MNCVFYNYKLQKKIPCVIIPNDTKEEYRNSIKIVLIHVYYDSSKYDDYNLTQQELNRHSSEFVNFYDLYPTNTQEQIDYCNLMLPLNSTINNHLELDRFQKLIEMITNVESLSRETFYRLADLISYDILFMYCNQEELHFMAIISQQELSVIPETIFVPQMLHMIKYIFSKYASPDVYYDIVNYNDYYNFRTILPITLNINYIKNNLIFLNI